MSLSLLVRITCVWTLLCAAQALAQSGRITGQVTDPQGQAISGAEVQALNRGSLIKLTAKTNQTGEYAFPFLPAATYQLIVRAAGFSQAVSGDLSVIGGKTLIYNAQLSVGATKATINVDASAADAVQINTTNSEVSGTLTGKEVSTLQLNGRNFTQLVALTPGVSNQTQQDEAKVGVLGSVAFSVDGGRTEYNSFSVDGSETLNVGINRDHSTLLVYPSVDAIQEIKVLTSNYGAEYPSTGNGTTLVTTRSGTDQLHGNLYEFLRNEDFNAKGYFDIGNSAPLYRRNDFGGTIGGPVVIPKLYDGLGKTHFFFSEEARLEKTPTPYRVSVPSLSERAGDFSDVCPITDPNLSVGQFVIQYPDCPLVGGAKGGTQFPGNRVTVATTAANYLQRGTIPLPNSYSGCNSSVHSCYLSDPSLPTYFREELFRFDHNISPSMLFSFHYIHDEWDATTPIPQYSYITNSFPTIQNRFYGPGLSLVTHLTNTFSGTLVNDFAVSYTNSHITLADVPAANVSLTRDPSFDAAPCALTNSVTSAGYPNDTGCGLGYLFKNGFGAKAPGIAIAGNNAAYGGNGFAVDPGFTPWSHNNPVYSITDAVSKNLGHHSLQFGAQWVIFQRNQTNGAIGAATGDTQGLLTFSNERSDYSTGNAFADFLSMSAISSFQQDSAQRRYYQRYQIAEPYLQDDWKATSRLTVNAGLRISLFGTYREKNGQAYNWTHAAYSPSAGNSVLVSQSGELQDPYTGVAIPTYLQNGSVNPVLINGIVQCGKNGVPSGCMSGHLFNPSPRAGFAWDPKGEGKTAIRAGYGIFFEHGTSDEANTGSLEGSAPEVLSMTQLNINALNCVGNVGAGCSNLGPGAYPLNVTSIPTKAVWSYVQQWSLSVERQVVPSTLASVAYVASKGTHLTVQREINQILPTSPATNPFGLHEPLNTGTCSAAGFFSNSFTLPSGAVIAPGDSAYINLRTACVGKGIIGNFDPNSLRQYAPGIGQIYSLENIANSAYNSLQLSLRTVTKPLTVGVAYTYSHSFDDASDRSDATFTNSFDIRSDRASSSFDQRHLLHLSYIYSLPIRPFFQHVISKLERDPDPDSRTTDNSPGSYLNSHFAKSAFDGWQLSGITLFETGIPFTVVNGGSANGISVLDNAGVDNGVGSGSYPDRVGSVHGHIPATGNNASSFGPLLLNPGAFAAPRGLTFGTSGRNSLNNPQRTNFDMALQKDFALPFEHASLTFRAESFNVFNHTQFRIYNPTLGNQANNTANCYGPTSFSAGDPGSETKGDAGCLTGSSFLHPVDAHRPRTIQFGLKLAF